MFSYGNDYYQFLNEWARVLLTASSAKVIYYIGSCVWMPADDFSTRPVPNFIVRTVNPMWRLSDTAFTGEARHDFIDQVDPVALREFYARWCHFGWTPLPVSEAGDHDRLTTDTPGEYVRIIEVPAGTEWGGPQFLDRIPNGVSVKRIQQTTLQRYNEKVGQLDTAMSYEDPGDESTIAKRW